MSWLILVALVLGVVAFWVHEEWREWQVRNHIEEKWRGRLDD